MECFSLTNGTQRLEGVTFDDGRSVINTLPVTTLPTPQAFVAFMQEGGWGILQLTVPQTDANAEITALERRILKIVALALKTDPVPMETVLDAVKVLKDLA